MGRQSQPPVWTSTRRAADLRPECFGRAKAGVSAEAPSLAHRTNAESSWSSQGVRIEPSTFSAQEKGQWFESSTNACKGASFEASPIMAWPSVRVQSPATQTHYATAEAKKTCKCRPFAKRLKGFEPSTFCMASSTSAAPRMQKRLQIDASGRLDGRFGFQELRGDTGGLDNERTMSDSDGGTNDEVATWSSRALSASSVSAGSRAPRPALAGTPSAARLRFDCLAVIAGV
jgi:hypothetical protein